ncbi:MAG TPA: hypothetical protein VHB27_09065 [Rhodopila sp.]|uniref:hypothetical protein n=1 Tax=Rhodopila sp. TaxID=2480087 RepID=UPI002C5F58E5|nr:hypothetical protein [Rhodopila sp.]HVY15366.1 hypothetical protein [Rhodopila sp.]
MHWIKSVAQEIFGLFVDDGHFAIAILAWVAFSALVLPHIPVPAVAKGPILFIGLAGILVDSATRRARR